MVAPRSDDDPLAELVHPFGDLLSFGVLVSAAMLWRHRPQAHKRLMVLATAGSMMAAPLAHLLGYLPAARAVPPLILLPLAALYFASAVYDKVRLGKVHPVSLWGGGALLTFAFARGAFIGRSDVWHRVAAWLIG